MLEIILSEYISCIEKYSMAYILAVILDATRFGDVLFGSNTLGQRTLLRQVKML